MAQPYVGEIRMFAGNFAPAGWMMCDGSLIPISENETLFQLLGTTYGGDGQSNFAIPDLRSRVPVHQGSGFVLGQLAGTETVTLTTQQIPVHNHLLMASAAIATQQGPAGNLLAQSTVAKMYIQDTADQALSSNSVTPIGGSQPHDNLQPFLCITFIISLFGIFPSQT